MSSQRNFCYRRKIPVILAFFRRKRVQETNISAEIYSGKISSGEKFHVEKRFNWKLKRTTMMFIYLGTQVSDKNYWEQSSWSETNLRFFAQENIFIYFFPLFARNLVMKHSGLMPGNCYSRNLTSKCQFIFVIVKDFKKFSTSSIHQNPQTTINSTKKINYISFKGIFNIGSKYLEARQPNIIRNNNINK